MAEYITGFVDANISRQHRLPDEYDDWSTNTESIAKKYIAVNWGIHTQQNKRHLILIEHALGYPLDQLQRRIRSSYQPLLRPAQAIRFCQKRLILIAPPNNAKEALLRAN